MVWYYIKDDFINDNIPHSTYKHEENNFSLTEDFGFNRFKNKTVPQQLAIHEQSLRLIFPFLLVFIIYMLNVRENVYE